jgi:Domain of unknown function (DUF6602)
MRPPFWSENLDRLRESLLAQFKRIQRGSSHSTIKGTSLEVVLRRALREYVPGHFAIGSGQITNRVHQLSPQIDVLVYDQTVFPHLAVNEDSTVVICCEALFGAVECKTAWDADVCAHFSRFVRVEGQRNRHYAESSNAAAYYVVIFKKANLSSRALSGLADPGRFVGVYTVEDNKCWSSAEGTVGFTKRPGNALALFLKDVLLDCMEKGPKDLGNFGIAYEVVSEYIDAQTGVTEEATAPAQKKRQPRRLKRRGPSKSKTP